MGNRIVTLSSYTPHLSAYNAELYIDVATHSALHEPIDAEEPNINDYLALLRTENDVLSNLIVAEYENEYEVISAIALVLLTGYEDEYAKYLAYMNNSKFKISKIVNYEAIRNSIHLIFTWIKGERILDPEFGHDLRKLLYEGINDITSELIVAEIRHCVSLYEPRVLINRIENISTIEDTEDNIIRLDIVYSVPSLEINEARYTFTHSTNPR